MSTKIYSYGANAPITQLEAVRSQMRIAHRYRNLLVSLEIKKRRRVNAAIRRVAPRILDLDLGIAERDARIEEARREMKRRRILTRSRTVHADLAAWIKTLVAELKVLNPALKALKTEMWASPLWQAEQDPIDAWFYPKKKRLYNAVGKPVRLRGLDRRAREPGLEWGTRLAVDASMANAHKGPPPRFKRWDGHGRVVVQIQKGMSIEALRSHSRLRLRHETVTRPSRASALVRNGPRKGLPRLVYPARKLGDAVVSLRIGSTGRRRGPVFAEIPITLHRPLPPEASIKWAWLSVSRIGTHEEWRMQFTLTDVPSQDDHAVSGAVGIDVGWRMQGSGSTRRLRVAAWLGQDGERGELALPGGWLDQMRRVDDIHSIRSVAFNEAKEALASWAGRGTSTIEVPAVRTWKSPERLAGLIKRWKAGAIDPSDEIECLGCKGTGRIRFKGDVIVECRHCAGRGRARVVVSLDAWRVRDRHLLEFERNLCVQLQRGREDLYRKFAARTRRRFAKIFMEKLDLRKFHANKLVEEDEDDKVIKMHVRDACLSKLIGALKESGASKVSAEWTTKTCGVCGHRNKWTDQSPLMLTCAGCDAKWDQDFNAAANILRVGLTSGETIEHSG